MIELPERYHSVDKVASTATKSGVGHRYDDHVLFDVEWSRVPVASLSKNFELLVGKDFGESKTDWIGNQQNNIRANRDDGVPQQEQGVNTRANSSQEETDDPCSKRAGWDVFIIVADDSADLVQH